MTKRCNGPGCPLRPSAVRWDDAPRSEGFRGDHARRSRRRSVPTWESRRRNVGSMGRQEISSIRFGVINQHIFGVAPKKCSMGQNMRLMDLMVIHPIIGNTSKGYTV